MAKEIIDEEIDDEEDSTIVMVSEDGEEVEFNHIATLDYKDEWYIFVQPVELGDMEDDELLIFKIESDENGNDVFVPVEDEAVIEAVFAEFEKEMGNEGCNCGDDCDCDDECHCGEECHCDCEK